MMRKVVNHQVVAMIVNKMMIVILRGLGIKDAKEIPKNRRKKMKKQKKINTTIIMGVEEKINITLKMWMIK